MKLEMSWLAWGELLTVSGLPLDLGLSFSQGHCDVFLTQLLIYPAVTSEDVCCGIRNVKSLIKVFFFTTCVVLSCL